MTKQTVSEQFRKKKVDLVCFLHSPLLEMPSGAAMIFKSLTSDLYKY